MVEIFEVKCASGFLAEINFQLENIVQVSVHNNAFGIPFVAYPQLSTANSKLWYWRCHQIFVIVVNFVYVHMVWIYFVVTLCILCFFEIHNLLSTKIHGMLFENTYD